MKLSESIGLIVFVAYGLIGLAFSLGALFIFWGFFHGSWDFQEFITGIGEYVLGIAVIGGCIYFFTNNNQDNNENENKLKKQ